MADLYAVNFREDVVPAIEVYTLFLNKRTVLYHPETDMFFIGDLKKEPVYVCPSAVSQERHHFRELGLDGLLCNAFGSVYAETDEVQRDYLKKAFLQSGADLSKYSSKV